MWHQLPKCDNLLLLDASDGLQQMGGCVHPYRCQNHFLKLLEARVHLNVNNQLGRGCDVMNVWLKEVWTTWSPKRWVNKPLYSLSHLGLSLNLILRAYNAWPAARGVVVSMTASGQLCTQQFMDDARPRLHVFEQNSSFGTRWQLTKQ